jgi:hypothetical protein
MINTSSPQPKSPLTPLYKGGEGEGEKAAIIAEIRAIYRDHRYQAEQVNLEKYSEAQLVVHLRKLKAGAYEWMKGKPKRTAGGDACATCPPVVAV